MSLLPFPGSSVANAPKQKRPCLSRFRYYTDAAYSHSGKDSGKEMKQVAPPHVPIGTAIANGM